ncbi:MAG TPA: AAA family ATPase, partial [Caulobacteraceae bacterium]
MLVGLAIRDVVLADRLDLSFEAGLTVLTGETGAGKSLLLDALGLAIGARSEAALVRRGASQASATAVFCLPPEHEAWAVLSEKGFAPEPGGELVLRRGVGADGRSRAFINDQPAGVAALRELGEALVQTHGQHQTVGLMDSRSHRTLLDAFGGLQAQAETCAETWMARAAADRRLSALQADAVQSQRRRVEITEQLGELDRLAPRPGEEAALAEERALLGAAERAIAEIAAAREALAADALSAKLGQAFRSLSRARERTLAAGVAEEGAAVGRLLAAGEAVDRILIEVGEAASAIDAAFETFAFEPDRLEKAEERLFALRAAARRLDIAVEALPDVRASLAASLASIDAFADSLAAAEREAAEARLAYGAAAETLGEARRAAAGQLAARVHAELGPLRLGKARFRVAVEPLPENR